MLRGSWKLLQFSIFRDSLGKFNNLVLGKAINLARAQLAPRCYKFPNFWNPFDTFVKGRPSNSNFNKCPWQLVDTHRNSNASLKGFLAKFWFQHFTAYPSCMFAWIGSNSSTCTGRLLQGLLGELSWKPLDFRDGGGHDFFPGRFLRK